MKKKQVEPKRERRVSREVRYFIFQKTENGKLKVPMERRMYDNYDSAVFDKLHPLSST